MKFVLVIAVVLVAVWIWRNNRREEHRDEAGTAARRPASPASPAPMVACGQCGMHLPQDEAVRGQRGVYCCHEHRRQAEEATG